MQEQKPPNKTMLVSFHDVKGYWDQPTQAWKSDEFVYIGRSNRTYGLATSPFANPFVIAKDTPEERAIAISKYREYITKLMNEVPGMKEVFENLRGKTLVCWCKSKNNPKACHGDVLLELLDEKPIEQPRQMALFDVPRKKVNYD